MGNSSLEGDAQVGNGMDPPAEVGGHVSKGGYEELGGPEDAGGSMIVEEVVMTTCWCDNT